MADSSASLSACLLVRAVCASLRLTDESVDSLTTSQLLALQSKLGETFGVIDSKIRDRESSSSGKQKVVIDLSDWEDSETDETANEQMRTSEDANGPPPIPSPRPTATLLGQEIADPHNVVDHGHEVRTLVYNTLSTRAVSSVPHGYRAVDNA